MKKFNIMNGFLNKLFNINNQNNKHNFNNSKDTNMDFIINGIYQSNDESEVIEVIGESDYPNVFNVLIVSSKIREKSTEPIMMAEPELLNRYTFIREKNNNKIFQKFGNESAKRTIKLTNTVKHDTLKTVDIIGDSSVKLLDESALIDSLIDEGLNQPNQQTSVQQTYAKPDLNLHHNNTQLTHKESTIKEPSFNEQLVNKIIDKNSGVESVLSINLTTDLDIENILKGIEYIDINVNEFMDMLFKNPKFIDSLKASFVESLTNQDYIKGEVFDMDKDVIEPTINAKLDSILDLLVETKTEVLASKEFTVEWSNMIFSTSEKNNLKLMELSDKFDSLNEPNLTTDTVIDFDSNIINPPIIETSPIDVVTDEVIDEVSDVKTEPSDYNQMIDSFIKRNIKN